MIHLLFQKSITIYGWSKEHRDGEICGEKLISGFRFEVDDHRSRNDTRGDRGRRRRRVCETATPWKIGTGTE